MILFKNIRTTLYKRLPRLLTQVDDEGRNMAHYLAWLGEEAALSHLLSLLPSLANMVDEEGNTPMHLAVRGGAPCLASARVLLSLHNTLVDLPDFEGNTPLHIAARF